VTLVPIKDEVSGRASSQRAVLEMVEKIIHHKQGGTSTENCCSQCCNEVLAVHVKNEPGKNRITLAKSKIFIDMHA
jgi:hypothetical protein